ncbi:MAG: hypothetical protein MJZ06_00020 [Bacteroidaceae bacterium]|nr:hypothetical protein [Bacteroidaceae bacterium]
MPRYIPNLRFADCWSSIGNVTFFHIDERCYWRTRPRPVFPGTPGQLHQLDIHRRALAAWRTITSQEQQQWNAYAKKAPSSRPPYTEDHHITGHNLFVSAYHGFAQLGNEHVPHPQSYQQFPVATVQSVAATVINGKDMQLNCTVLMKTATPPTRFRVAARIQLADKCQGKNSGLMRSFLSVTQQVRTLHEDSEQGMYLMTVLFTLDRYRSIWNIDGPDCNMYSKFFMIDRVTGYRKLFWTGHSLLTAY